MILNFKKHFLNLLDVPASFDAVQVALVVHCRPKCLACLRHSSVIFPIHRLEQEPLPVLLTRKFEQPIQQFEPVIFVLDDIFEQSSIVCIHVYNIHIKLKQKNNNIMYMIPDNCQAIPCKTFDLSGLQQF